MPPGFHFRDQDWKRQYYPPMKHCQKNQRVASLIIEVNRSPYTKPSGFNRIKSDQSYATSQAVTIGFYIMYSDKIQFIL